MLLSFGFFGPLLLKCVVLQAPCLLLFSFSINATSTILLPLCSPCFVIFICWNKADLAEAISRNAGFYKPKNLLSWCKPTPFDSDCRYHKAQCNHTEETRRRRHVIMINQRRVRRAGENRCRPTRDCQGSGVGWVRAPSAVGAPELSGDSSDPDRLNNNTDQSVFSLPIEQQFPIRLLQDLWQGKLSF